MSDDNVSRRVPHENIACASNRCQRESSGKSVIIPIVNYVQTRPIL
jgi:hypothetical protein